jgi:hypothetical protein
MVSQAATLTFGGAEMASHFLKTSEKPYFPTINAWFARFNPGGLKIFAQIIPRLKSQRDFVTQPKVAIQWLPWVNSPHHFSTLKGLPPARKGHNPVGVDDF